MVSGWSRASFAQRANFIALASFVALAFAFGGSARADALSQPVVYLAAILLAAGAIAQAPAADTNAARWPLWCLIGLGTVIVLQLIPLPPAIWRSLPGRAFLASALDLIGLGAGWRPLSLTPDATLNALVALLPPLAVLLMGRRIPRLVDGLLPIILICAAASALLAILQIGGAVPYLYRITTYGAAVGLMANRNHQAALLVCTVPLLAAWATRRGGASPLLQARPWIALLAIASVVPLLMITGSRGGLVFGGIALLAAVALARPDRALRERVLRGRTRSRGAVLAAVLAFVVIVPAAAAVFLSRDEALQRLLGGSAGDRRIEWVGLFRKMAWDYFPFGSGFGSFESVFRAYEPYEGLADTYLNNAHNDLIEIIIEGGAFALLPLILFIGWWLVSSARAWRTPEHLRRTVRDRTDDSALVLARAASVVLAILFAWSLVDYPLRTPALAVLAAICCLLLRVDVPYRSPVGRTMAA